MNYLQKYKNVRVLVFTLSAVLVMTLASCQAGQDESANEAAKAVNTNEETSQESLSTEDEADPQAENGTDSVTSPSLDDKVTEFVDAVNARDIELAMSLLAPDAEITFGEQGEFSGADEIQTWLNDMFGQILNIKIENIEVVDGTVEMSNAVKRIGLQDWKIDTLTGLTIVTLEEGKIKDYTFELDEESQAMLPVEITSADEVLGVWQRAKPHSAIGEIFLKLNEEGIYQQTTGSAERLETNPMVEGEFKIEGENFVITNETQLGESYMWDCEDPGMVGEYKALWLANGNLLIQVESEECRNREDVFASEYVSVE